MGEKSAEGNETVQQLLQPNLIWVKYAVTSSRSGGTLQRAKLMETLSSRKDFGFYTRAATAKCSGADSITI